MVISVCICDEKTSALLNNEYRKINKPTDVLSWGFIADNEEWIFPDDEPKTAGEIAVCAEICEQQAITNGWDFNTEFVRLLVHGVAHICGYEHQDVKSETEMIQFENKILSNIGYPDIYP